MLNCERSLTRRLQAAEFRVLLQMVKPVSVDHLAARMDVPASITSGIGELQRSAYIRLDSNGCIVGALGLSMSTTMHELLIGGSRFWAWYAFDVIGIFGAISASGLARSVDPCNGEDILLEFTNGIPHNKEYIVFMADVQSNSALCEEWCSKVNFFTSTESAEVWTQTNGLAGALVSVGNLVPVAVKVWSRLLGKGEEL